MPINSEVYFCMKILVPNNELSLILKSFYVWFYLPYIKI